MFFYLPILIIGFIFNLFTSGFCSHFDFNILGEEKVSPCPYTIHCRQKVETVRILSVDGGAMRGMVPATILRELENEIGQPLSQVFHLMGGTSVGCVLTSALTTPADPTKPVHLWKPKTTAADLVQLFYTQGENILRRKPIPFGSIYDVQSLEGVIEGFTGETIFNQSITPTAGIICDVLAVKNKAICSWEKDIYLRKDVILSSSAAPFLFYPRTLAPVGFNTLPEKQTLVIDGGIGANNPAAILIKKAKELYPNVKRFDLVSLGVGIVRTPIYYDLFNGTFSAESILGRVIDFGINILSSCPEKYIQDILIGEYNRFNPVIPSINASITDKSRSNLEALEKASMNYIKENRSQLDKLVTRLKLPKD